MSTLTGNQISDIWELFQPKESEYTKYVPAYAATDRYLEFARTHDMSIPRNFGQCRTHSKLYFVIVFKEGDKFVHVQAAKGRVLDDVETPNQVYNTIKFYKKEHGWEPGFILGPMSSEDLESAYNLCHLLLANYEQFINYFRNVPDDITELGDLDI